MKGYDIVTIFNIKGKGIAKQFSEAISKYDDIKVDNCIDNNDGIELLAGDTNVIYNNYIIITVKPVIN
ncbi:hypothetical protein ACFL50_02050 [Candidatus Latescibacterota bacterium]